MKSLKCLEKDLWIIKVDQGKSLRMEDYMNEQTNERMNERKNVKNARTIEQKSAQTNKKMHEQTKECTNERTKECTNERKNAQTNKKHAWTNERMRTDRSEETILRLKLVAISREPLLFHPVQTQRNKLIHVCMFIGLHVRITFTCCFC